MSYQLAWEKNGVHSSFEGILSPEIHREALNALFSDARVDDIEYIIGDFSRVNNNLLNEKDVEYPLAVSSGAASYLKKLKVALVSEDEVINALCLRYIELSKYLNIGWKVRLFEDLESARTWVAHR